MSEQSRRDPRPWVPNEPRPQVRLTHQDRDAVAEVLREAYAKGQLEEDEFDERLDQAMRAKVASELVPLTTDLGVQGFEGNAPPGRAREGRSRGGERGPNDLRNLRTDNPVEKVGAGLSHASAFFFPLLGPLLVLLISPNSTSFMRRHALEALNFQLWWLVAILSSAVLSVLVLPVVLLLAVALGGLVLPVMAAATNIMGNGWRYPLTYRFIKDDQE
ncbi:MAG TPA: DUF1707 and DUF4870 domain-containing protein [Nocardiopsis listeri]|uniref:DUF4870 domain-containing protein n=1 Tax=Nocardiopsis listeri TaxID=53440 RepID=UPI001DBD182A|nr:DUF4870 domain-containing protein [Nocardiopsis listeri]HJE61233.1 DUF1707 and DUF4870 domain-containing protein [Nocardiopsis listeri]